MNLQLNKRYVFILFGIALILIVAIIFVVVSLFSKENSSLFDTSTSVTPTSVPYTGTAMLANISPTDKATSVNQLDGVIVTFETPLPQSITISLSPSLQGEYTRDEKSKKITFSPTNGFKTQTTYTATLSIGGQSFTLPSNKSVSKYSWSFKTGEQMGETGFDKEAGQQFSQTLKKAEDAYQERKTRLPFIIYMPYVTTHFTISISAMNDTVTITTHGNTQVEIDSYKTEAVNWLKSHGGNTDNLVIIYQNSP